MGLKYEGGGNESGFKHAKAKEEGAKRLLMIKGKRQVTCKEIECNFGSMNKGDAFILDDKEDLFIWCGPSVNIIERNKAGYIASMMRNNEK